MLTIERKKKKKENASSRSVCEMTGQGAFTNASFADNNMIISITKKAVPLCPPCLAFYSGPLVFLAI